MNVSDKLFSLLMDFCTWLGILKTDFCQMCSRCRGTIGKDKLSFARTELVTWLIKIQSSDLGNEPHATGAEKKSSPVHGGFLLHGFSFKKLKSVCVESPHKLHCTTSFNSCMHWLGFTRRHHSLCSYAVFSWVVLSTFIWDYKLSLCHSQRVSIDIKISRIQAHANYSIF